MDKKVYNMIIEELEDWKKRRDNLDNLMQCISHDAKDVPNDIYKKIFNMVEEEIKICEEQIEQISTDLEKIELKADLVAKYG